MVTFGSHVGNHQFQPFLSGVYAGVIFDNLQCYAPVMFVDLWLVNPNNINLYYRFDK